MKLSAKDRRRLIAGERLEFPIEAKDACPVGEEVLVSYGKLPAVPQVVLTWLGPVKRHGQFFAHYKITDTRADRLLRRGGGYTTNASLAIRDEQGAHAEGVDEETQAAITAGKLRVYEITHAEEIQRRKSRSVARQLREVAVQATNKGVSIVEDLEAVTERVQEMKRKLQDAA